MITEDYVSFQIAKLLKEKGFDEKCHAFYRKTLLNNKIIDTAELHISTHLSLTNSNLQDKLFKEIVYGAAPTLQMAVKWLREVHKIEVRVIYDNEKSSWYGACNPMNEPLQILLGSNCESNSYEKACENGIKYCLENLI